jgi:DNA repair ATPase RecN
VLVITHLHQIARVADHHFLAEKTGGRGKRITISVTELGDAGIAAELDRMIALPEEDELDQLRGRTGRSKLMRS